MLSRSHFSSDEEYRSALRDWFAGQALPMLKDAADDRVPPEKAAAALAKVAYALADAMIAERECQP